MHQLVMLLKEAESDALDNLEKCTKAIVLTNDEKKLIDILLTSKPIKLYITTHGGIIYAALKVVDIIRSLKVPVHTIVVGYVASAGTLLSLAGAKRFITPNSFMLVHELRSSFWGKYSEAREQIENMDKLMELLTKMMKENTKIPESELKEILCRDRNWDASECIEKGLVDELLK
jgi:ATP-dependent Clp protease protease subunit